MEIIPDEFHPALLCGDALAGDPTAIPVEPDSSENYESGQSADEHDLKPDLDGGSVSGERLGPAAGRP
jgi:hypothetical protein